MKRSLENEQKKRYKENQERTVSKLKIEYFMTIKCFNRMLKIREFVY